MKVRTNFVSNSSSSSFIVYNDDTFNMNKLTSEEINKLEKYGFFKTYDSHPDQLENYTKDIDKHEDNNYNYGYDVMCNEYEVIEWLLNNNIPFVADCHYGEYTLYYKKDSDNVIICNNIGKQLLMGSTFKYLSNKKPLVKVLKETLIKEGYQKY